MIQLPEPFSSLPREQLLYSHPSPIEPLKRLSSELASQDAGRPASTKFWIKREDSNSGLALGGNKIRKMEYVLPDALIKGATILVTTGGLQSNHMRQVAAAAARYGLKTKLVPKDRVKSSDAEYKNLGNIQITHLLSAEHAIYDSDAEEVMKDLAEKGEVPYWIPSGASTHPFGGLGYARFAFEIASQEQEMNVYFDTIVVPCASGSTLGGMIAGFKLLEKTAVPQRDGARKKRQIIGIDAFADAPENGSALVFQIAKTTAERIGLSDSDVHMNDVFIDYRWNAGTYGFVDETTQNAMKLMAQLEGIVTDPVYTGKALAGLIGRARLGEFKHCENVLYVHTGGVAVLSAYPNVS